MSEMVRTDPPSQTDDTKLEGGDDSYAIGELAAEFNITPRTIRYYESRGLIKPRRIGSSRHYSRRDRARLILILRGKTLGFTLEDIVQYLALYDTDPSQITQTRHLLTKVDDHLRTLALKKQNIERTIKELRAIKADCITHLTEVDVPGKSD